MSELVEKVARAICQTDSDPDELIGGKPMWTGWKDEARAAIAAVAEWLSEDPDAKQCCVAALVLNEQLEPPK